MIEDGQDGWEEMLPPGVSEIIKEKCLFSCSIEQQEQAKRTKEATN
jgi:hypothetical protein